MAKSLTRVATRDLTWKTRDLTWDLPLMTWDLLEIWRERLVYISAICGSNGCQLTGHLCMMCLAETDGSAGTKQQQPWGHTYRGSTCPKVTISTSSGTAVSRCAYATVGNINPVTVCLQTVATDKICFAVFTVFSTLKFFFTCAKICFWLIAIKY